MEAAPPPKPLMFSLAAREGGKNRALRGLQGQEAGCGTPCSLLASPRTRGGAVPESVSASSWERLVRLGSQCSHHSLRSMLAILAAMFSRNTSPSCDVKRA
jgi:hypothetical protein